MLAFADVMHLFADEFARLSRGRLALAFVAPRACPRRFLRHIHLRIAVTHATLVPQTARGTLEPIIALAREPCGADEPLALIERHALGFA